MASGDRYILKSPLYFKGVYGGKNKEKNFAVNRNRIHESHVMVIAKAKVLYKELMKEQILALPMLGRFKILYVVHRGNKRKADRGNASYETCKFFMDALKHFGKILDDSDEYYDYAVHKTGEICKGDPHVEIIIEEIATIDEMRAE